MTRKEQIKAILDDTLEVVVEEVDINGKHYIGRKIILGKSEASEKIAALPLDVPGDEDVLNYAVDHNRTQKYTTIDYYATGRAEGAKWMRSEILKRNIP